MLDSGIHPPYRILYNLSIGFCTNSAMRSIQAMADLMEALGDENSSLRLTDIDTESVLNELQNIVLQGAAVSRYFWPIRNGHEKRGKALRNQYGITDESPLRSRELRNLIEHFDERLDNYLSKGIVGNIIPHYLGREPPPSQVKRHFFRAYFLDSGVFEMLGQRYEIDPLSRELWRIGGGSIDEPRHE